MSGDPETVFWIIVAGLSMLFTGLMGLGAVIIAIIELALKGGSTDGTKGTK
jgi:hypothetical protein